MLLYIWKNALKKLLSFIERHRQDKNYVFWSDLESAHYETNICKWMTENVNFVPIKTLTNQMFQMQGQSKVFGVIWAQKFMKLVGKQKQVIS